MTVNNVLRFKSDPTTVEGINSISFCFFKFPSAKNEVRHIETATPTFLNNQLHVTGEYTCCIAQLSAVSLSLIDFLLSYLSSN